MQKKTVIITGASRGIGEATAYLFAQSGYNVVLAARSEGSIKAIADKITQEGGSALARACDVSEYDQIAALADAALQQFGSLDVLINNAGILDPVERLEDADPKAWQKVIDINVTGVFHGIRSALPIMKKQGGGTIITVGSGAATSALEGWSAYCTSKAAVHHLNSCVHKENAEDGIRAMIMSPGTVATKMQEVIRDSGVNPVSQIPWENHIPPEWVAKVFLWMCGPDADPYLGQTVALRGEDLRHTIGV